MLDHTDHPKEGAFAAMLLLGPRSFVIDGVSAPIDGKKGDVLIFKGNKCHYGKGLSNSHKHSSIALHCYMGSVITPQSMVFTHLCGGMQEAGQSTQSKRRQGTSNETCGHTPHEPGPQLVGAPAQGRLHVTPCVKEEMLATQATLVEDQHQ